MRRELRHVVGNKALVLGIFGALVLFAMGAIGGLAAPYDPNAGTGLLIRDLPNGTTSFAVPPTGPDSAHWFGTDALGRDQWSRVLVGARLSMTIILTATLIRLALGIVLGLVTGWYGGSLARAISLAASGVAAVPQLLLAIMLVLVTRSFGVLGFIASLAFVGWPDTVEFVRAETGRIKLQSFIEAARAVGSPGRRLITKHVAAALGPQLLTIAVLETGAVLLLLAELGLVGLFLAGATAQVGDLGQFVGVPTARAPEWGQMLGSIQFFAMTNQLATLVPALFIVLAAASFGLLADGIRAASDPFDVHRLLPSTFNALTKVLAGALCFSAIGFIAVTTPASTLTMDEGREVASKTAESAWPGSVFVAGVARYETFSRGLQHPDRLTYYFRNAKGEILRISFQNADRLAVEVRQYENEDGIDFSTLAVLPAGLVSYDRAVGKAETAGGADFRKALGNYIVRAILTWPRERTSPIYSVTYGTSGRGQLVLRSLCCVDGRSGDEIGIPSWQSLGAP